MMSSAHDRESLVRLLREAADALAGDTVYRRALEEGSRAIRARHGQRAVEEWNAKNPVGTRLRERGGHREVTTSYPAFLDGYGDVRVDIVEDGWVSLYLGNDSWEVVARPLHVYKNDESSDCVIAESPEDAAAWCRENYGNDAENGNPAVWRELPDDSPLSMHEQEIGYPLVTKTCAEWIAVSKRGFLCSTNY